MVLFDSSVAFYKGPIQTGFLMTFQKSYGRTGIVIPAKKHHRSKKNRNPEDFYRNYQPRHVRPAAIRFVSEQTP